MTFMDMRCVVSRPHPRGAPERRRGIAMIPAEVHPNLDEQQVTEQGETPGEPLLVAPPIPPTGMPAAREDAPPTATAPPAPPSRLAAGVQRLSPGGRWALGLGLAFLSGLTFLLSPYISGIGLFGSAIAVVVMFLLALAAGFVLSNWWSVLALAVAAAAGGWAGGWVFVQLSPGGDVEGINGLQAVSVVFSIFALLTLVPLILFLLGGVGLGREQRLTLEPPHALSAREIQVSRWIAALAPVVAAGYFAPTVGYIPGMQGDVVFTISAIFYAVVLAASCLLAGWLLRSWWGLVVAPVAYAGVAILATLVLPWFGGGGDWGVWPVGFALYIVLPAIVMSAIGTAIGMYRDRRAGPPPQQGELAV